MSKRDLFRFMIMVLMYDVALDSFMIFEMVLQARSVEWVIVWDMIFYIDWYTGASECSLWMDLTWLYMVRSKFLVSLRLLS